MLDFLNRFSSDIKKTNVVNNIKKLELDIELKNKEIESYNKKMEHDKISAQLNYQNSASKSSFILSFIIYGMCIGSILLTPMGFGLLDGIIEGLDSGVLEGKGSKKEVVDFTLTSLLTVIIMVNGLMGFYYASITSQVSQFFYKLNGIFFFITITAIPISIAGNCNMLYTIMKFTNIIYIDLPIVVLICILWDLSVIAGLRLKHYKKYRNYQFREDIEEQESDRLTIINMLKTFTIDFIKFRLMGRFYDMRNKIDDEYKKHNSHENSHENSHDKSHEINSEISNEKIINFHDKSHEKTENNLNKNNLNLDEFHEENRIDLRKENSINSHENFSRENQDESYDISSMNSNEKINNFSQNYQEKTHENKEISSHEKNDSNSHEKSHENNKKNDSNSHDNSHEVSHDQNNTNLNKNNSNSHEKSHDKIAKRNTAKKSILEKIEDYINENYKSGDKIIVKDLKKNLKLGEYDWTSNRKKLMKSNKVKVDGSDTYVA